MSESLGHLSAGLSQRKEGVSQLELRQPSGRDLKRDLPDLTLDMALRLLRSAFARPQLTEEDAMCLVEYHLQRNRTAHQSHRKSWLQKHKRIEPEVSL